jgi:hypothetical protein
VMVLRGYNYSVRLGVVIGYKDNNNSGNSILVR